MKLLTLALATFAVTYAVAAPPPPAPMPTVADFQPLKWEGFWYELYSIPQTDETGCSCTASNFSQNVAPNQWTDLNHCKRLGHMMSVPLTMYQMDRAHPERLAIGMAPWMLFSKMWVVATDYTSYSLIADPSRTALWIYGRNPGINHQVYANLTQKASDLGFDISQLKMTDQNNDCVYPDHNTPDQPQLAPQLAAPTAAKPILLHQVGGNICEDITIDLGAESSLNQVKEWWAGNEYKYKMYSPGLCPKPFVHVDHSEHPIGIAAVTYRELGIVPTPTVTALREAADTTLYKTKGDGCGQATLDSKYASYAEKFAGLKEGTCADHGFTVADGTQSIKVPVLGAITITKFKKAGTPMWAAALQAREGGATPAMDCAFNDTATFSLALTHPGGGNIKIRTCRTGIGCVGTKGKWNSFKDCEYYLGAGQSVDLKFEQKVAYFDFYNTKTDKDEELWRAKDGSWPTAYSIQV